MDWESLATPSKVPLIVLQEFNNKIIKIIRICFINKKIIIIIYLACHSIIQRKVVYHQKIREFEKRLMITCWFGAGEGNWIPH